MKNKKNIFILAACGFIFLGWATLTYPKIGELTYHAAAATESYLYGFRKDVVDIEGVPVAFYRSSGKGPAIVMLHGFSAEKNHWLRFARYFASDHQVIIPDLAGHGETGFRPEWSYTTGAQAALIRSLMERLGVKQAHLIGNSMGGSIAAQFAIQYPDRLLSLALIDPAGLKAPRPSDLDRMLAQGDNPFLIASREDFYRLYPMSMARPPFAPSYVLDALADEYKARRPQLEHIFKDFLRSSDIAGRLHEIAAPTLLIWGDEDRLLDVSTVPVWRGALPELQVQILSGVGHMPMAEAPKETAKLYQDFLASQGEGARAEKQP